MKKTICLCDRCGDQIPDVVYVLTCYAEIAPGENPAKHINLLNEQNNRQNTAKINLGDRHLCRKCKDEITDGVFLV